MPLRGMHLRSLTINSSVVKRSAWHNVNNGHFGSELSGSGPKKQQQLA
jgi:hypothetical protein